MSVVYSNVYSSYETDGITSHLSSRAWPCCQASIVAWHCCLYGVLIGGDGDVHHLVLRDERSGVVAENKSPRQDNFDDSVQSDSGDGRSRRAFLKAAVVGSAAVAAVGGASAAGLALAHKVPQLPLRFAGAAEVVSPNEPCAVCTTGTNPDNFVDQDTFNNNESMFLWVRFINIPAGSYTIDVTPTIQSQNSACVPATPLQYQSPHNSVTSWVLPAGGLACHPAKLSDLPGGTSSDSLPASFSTAQIQDLMVAVHLQNGCTTASDVTIHASLKRGSTTVLDCSHSIHINAH